MLTNCGICNRKYPDNLLSQNFIIGSEYTKLICGICALEEINKNYGIDRKELHGIIAEHMRLLAIKWRKKRKEIF